MNDTAPTPPNGTRKRIRKATKKRAPQPEGERTVIQVPHPPGSALNKNRPITELIRSQLRHIQHAESARLPKKNRVGIKLEDIKTEAQAASYIAAVTKVLHPLRRKKSKPGPGS